MKVELGQRVMFAHPLYRRSVPGTANEKRWRSYPWDKKERTGIIVGVRTLSDGIVHWGDYDTPTTYEPKHYFRAYLIATDLVRKPVLVSPDDVTVTDA